MYVIPRSLFKFMIITHLRDCLRSLNAILFRINRKILGKIASRKNEFAKAESGTFARSGYVRWLRTATIQPSLRDPDLEYTQSFMNNYGRVCFVRTNICGGIQLVSKLQGYHNISFMCVARRYGC